MSSVEERLLPVGIIQHSFTDDVETNRSRNEQSIVTLAEEGARLIVLSELHDSLYFCQTENVDNFDLANPIPGDFTAFYSRVAYENEVVIVASTFEKRACGLYHNTAVVFETNGSICGIYRKMHIPDDPGFYEKFYFTPGDLGFEPIETSVGMLGVLVCWDQWYPEAARLMSMKGAEILIYPTAIGWNPDDSDSEKRRQLDAWITIQRSHAVANGVPVISVNRVGYEEDPSGQTSGIDFWGSSFAAGPQGEMLTECSESEVEERICVLDMSRSEDVRRWWPFFRDRRIDSYGDIMQRFGNR